MKRREVETLHSAYLCALSSNGACPLWVALGPAGLLDAVAVDVELAKRATGSRRRSVLGDPRELGPLADGASMDLPLKGSSLFDGDCGEQRQLDVHLLVRGAKGWTNAALTR